MPEAATVGAKRVYRPVIDRTDVRRSEIARLDAISRTRALTDQESRRLEGLLYRDRYAQFRSERRPPQ